MNTPNEKAAECKLDQGQQERTKAFRLLLIQVLATIMMAGVGWLAGTDAVVPLLVGGAIGISASAWMALVLLRRAAADTPQRLLGALYVGELGKYLFVMAFFAIAFKKVVLVREPHNALLMIGAFTITQMVIWLWPLLTVKVNSRTKKRS